MFDQFCEGTELWVDVSGKAQRKHFGCVIQSHIKPAFKDVALFDAQLSLAQNAHEEALRK